MNSMNNIDRLAKIINELEGSSKTLATKLLNDPSITITFNSPTPTLDEIKNATPGETLVDNSVLVFCNSEFALIAAPEATEIKTTWDNRHQVFYNLKAPAFDCNDWFIPTLGELYLAWVMCRENFSSTGYWSSTEVNACCACSVYFGSGSQGAYSKTISFCVRAFRKVVF